MKKLIAFFGICVITLGGCNSQNNASDKCIIMLKEFYTTYCKIWNIRPIPHPNDHYIKIDSLQEKYCTQRLRKEAKEWFFDGHDLLTNDWGIDIESLETMKIIQDSIEEKTYIVSYVVDSYPIAPDKPIKKQVVLHVTVVKEGENYMIDSVR